MKISRISDKKDDIKMLPKEAKIKGLDAYKAAAEQHPDNFYLALGLKLYTLFNPTGKKGSKNGISTQTRVLKNDIIIATSSEGKGYIAINGKRVNASGKGIAFAEDAVLKAFEAEIKGDISVIRPEGRTIKKDRLDFKDAEGTMFTRLKDKATSVDGRRSFALKGNINKEYAVTEAQASEDETFDASKFKKYSNPNLTYYVKKNVQVVDLTGTASSLKQVLNAIFNTESELDLVARNPKYEFVYKDHPTDPYVVVAFEDNLFIVEWSSFGWKMKKKIQFPSNIKIQ